MRALTAGERTELAAIARAGSERADRGACATALLAVADGATFTAAAQAAGRRSGDGVSQVVARFNREGLAAVTPRHSGGASKRYGATEQERILREFRRAPDRERDGTATWSLTTLQRALRTAPDGLPRVSTKTILHTLWAAGYTWQQRRTWCHTGTAQRKRKDGSVVTTTDPDATPKKTSSTVPPARPRRWASPCGVRTRPVPPRPSRSQVPPGSRRASRRASRTSTFVGGRPSY